MVCIQVSRYNKTKLLLFIINRRQSYISYTHALKVNTQAHSTVDERAHMKYG